MHHYNKHCLSGFSHYRGREVLELVPDLLTGLVNRKADVLDVVPAVGPDSPDDGMLGNAEVGNLVQLKRRNDRS